MRAFRTSFLLLAGTMLAATISGHARAAEEELAPYKMLRSMQFVQDSVVRGDHSAGEMQRYLLGAIDKRLRTVDSSIFEDPRNVDATLIYAMSGGNPATLEYLVDRDVQGYFDNRVAEVLRKYLNGKGQMASKTLVEMAKEYASKPIGPYLALVAGNTLMNAKPEEALKMYSWARLTSPGTIVEEAALRRSLSIAVNAGLVEEGVKFSSLYARRFLHSPYASQFADLFVALAVDNVHVIGLDRIRQVAEVMEPDRRQAIYLRIARQATIAGEMELASMAADEAAKVKGTETRDREVLANFYSGLAGVPSDNVVKAAEGLDMVPDAMLSPKDKMLRDAARAIAEEVLREPDPASLTQETPDNKSAGNSSIDADAAGHDEPAPGQEDPLATQPAVADAAAPTADSAQPSAPDTAIDPIITSARSKLGEIDKLLEKDSTPP
ncbi:chemotaxis protein MotC [Gellertiella hungarica]|uniref:Chemotaxis protein MotC n=1 Tax=Gellertiella hungarica TaxID=1572859 RepID=A0A7W6NJU2_9HYPH|nr:chemotaxis protein MotC [Gellertiella hungarica]MBB4064133.1 chemotaxis protein MotC [Gellertiella hungarica]